MKAIYKRELRSYFGSMYGYVYLAFTLCVIGIYVTMKNQCLLHCLGLLHL